MCIIAAQPQGAGHVWNQFLAGLFFGLTSGYAHHTGHTFAANCISSFLLVITVLDHLGVILVPWGYRGPGTEPGRFRGAMTLDQLVYEFFAFLVNNVTLYVTYILFFLVGSGHLILNRDGRVVVWA